MLNLHFRLSGMPVHLEIPHQFLPLVFLVGSFWTAKVLINHIHKTVVNGLALALPFVHLQPLVFDVGELRALWFGWTDL